MVRLWFSSLPQLLAGKCRLWWFLLLMLVCICDATMAAAAATHDAQLMTPTSIDATSAQRSAAAFLWVKRTSLFRLQPHVYITAANTVCFITLFIDVTEVIHVTHNVTATYVYVSVRRLQLLLHSDFQWLSSVSTLQLLYNFCYLLPGLTCNYCQVSGYCLYSLGKCFTVTNFQRCENICNSDLLNGFGNP